MAFTVGQLAKRTGLTVRTLHHYHAIGLLVPSHRSESGYRLYTRGDIMRLYRVLALQRLGLSLTEIETVLAKDGAPLPEIIDQQLVELDEWIEQATALRARLTQLRGVMTEGGDPAAADWLAAVELIAHYERDFSPEELRRVIANRSSGQIEDWRALVADLRAAADNDVPPDDPRAQALLRRWRDLMMRTGGDDPTVVIKMKQAYQDQPEMRARVQVQSGLDADVLAFVARVFNHAHAALWTRYLGPDVCRLHIEGDRMEWLQVVAAMRSQMTSGADSGSADVQQLLERWEAQIVEFTGGDRRLIAVVSNALDSDAELQDMWAIDAELQAFVQRARGLVRASGATHG